MNEKAVEITIINRKGKGSHVETVPFTDMAALKTHVNRLLDELPFLKVIVELVPNWEASKEEQQSLTEIETKD